MYASLLIPQHSASPEAYLPPLLRFLLVSERTPEYITTDSEVQLSDNRLRHSRFQYARRRVHCTQSTQSNKSHDTRAKNLEVCLRQKKYVFDDDDSASWNQRRSSNLLDLFPTAVSPLSNRWRQETPINIFRVFFVLRKV